ncbi:MAG: hypothetical protein KDE32_10710 [Novosphingobium sp.]|nr:hypothetical protein [Novosphingobium sp.]
MWKAFCDPVIPFYLTFIAVLLSGLAARDQVAIAHYSHAHGRRWAMLAVAMAVSVATAAFAGYAAKLIVPLMAPAARVFLCAMAVLFAGAESLVIAPRARNRDPNRSLGLYSLTLLAHQLTDAARFIVFGIAVAAQAPITAAAGGALGGIVLVAAAWAYPQIALDARARLARRLLGVAFILIGAYIAMRAVDWV